MKQLILKSFLLILFGSLYPLLSFGNKDDSLYCVEINGKVAMPSKESSMNYKLILLCNNVVIDSGEVVDGEEFLLRVKKNSLYTIRILKPGYLPMVVSINTELPELKKKNKFNFNESCFLDIYGFHLYLSLLNQKQLISGTEPETP
jgi:hypothetical protein